MVLSQAGTTIDWEQLPTYNTIMAVAAGAGLVLLVRLGHELRTSAREVSAEGYALAFGVLGFLLTATGLHMTLAWPLAPAFPFDNIIFGETCLAFGVLLLAASLFAWRRGREVLAEPDVSDRLLHVARPLSVFIGGLGLSLIAIAAAGMRYRLFAAPPEEPFAGWWFSAHPWVEATFISALYALVGVGALALAVAIERRGAGLRVVGWCWGVAGVVFVLFGALNYFSHIGLVVETM